MAAPGMQGADLKAKVKEVADRFSTGQKAMMVGVTLAVVVALALVMRSASSTPMVPLYNNLAPEDAAAITEKLTSEGGTYELADGGATIMVPKEKVYDLRLQMAAEGLPETGPEGYSLLDEQGITASEFSQQVGFQRALEGELTKTIGSMDPIASSTVRLAIPKDDVFASEKGKASASVLVKTRPGKTLDATQVQAIVHLVASAVQGLEPEAITVADSNGQVLHAPGTEGGDAASADLNTKQRVAFEKDMSSSIEKLLEPVVGPGKARVTVSADLDYAQRKATSETFEPPSGDPAQLTPRSEVTKTETYAGAGAAEAGVLGPDGAPVVGGGTGDADYQLEQGETSYVYNRVVEESRSAPGTVRRMSVAVLVDAGATAVDQVAQIQNLVSAAAGLTPERGDAVQVSRMAFGGTEAALAEQQRAIDEAREAEAQAATASLIRQGAVVAFLLVLLALAYRSMRKAARRRAPGLWAGEVREITPQPTPPGTLVLEPPPVVEPAPPAELPEPAPAPPSDEELERQRMARQVEDMIDKQPVEVAQMLRGWLDDGRKAPR